MAASGKAQALKDAYVETIAREAGEEVMAEAGAANLADLAGKLGMKAAGDQASMIVGPKIGSITYINDGDPTKTVKTMSGGIINRFSDPNFANPLQNEAAGSGAKKVVDNAFPTKQSRDLFIGTSSGSPNTLVPKSAEYLLEKQIENHAKGMTFSEWRHLQRKQHPESYTGPAIGVVNTPEEQKAVDNYHKALAAGALSETHYGRKSNTAPQQQQYRPAPQQQQYRPAPQQQQYQPAPRRQGPIDYSGYGG
jgi:hypothetical protein